MARFQTGWLQKKSRKSGNIGVFCYRPRLPFRTHDASVFQSKNEPEGRGKQEGDSTPFRRFGEAV